MNGETDFFAELDEMEARNEAKETDLANEKRPYVMADLGVGPKQVIFWPPKTCTKEELTFNQLVTLMKEHETIPLGIGNELMFVGWDEARIFFGNRVDQFLIDHFRIFPTDSGEGEDADTIDTTAVIPT